MNLEESIYFLIFYVGIFAGIPLLWYATKVSPKNNESETVRMIVESDKTFEEAHRDAVNQVNKNAKENK